MNGTTAYALSKKYVASTADSLGSLKGAPCTIKSIIEVDGGIKYGLKRPNGISLVCKGRQNYAGKLPDGTPLKWMYYDDFLKLPQEEQNKILSRNQESSNDGSFIM